MPFYRLVYRYTFLIFKENGCVSRGKPRVVKSLSMSSPPVPAVDLGASSMRPSEVRSGLGTDHTQQATIHGLQVQIHVNWSVSGLHEHL